MVKSRSRVWESSPQCSTSMISRSLQSLTIINQAYPLDLSWVILKGPVAPRERRTTSRKRTMAREQRRDQLLQGIQIRGAARVTQTTIQNTVPETEPVAAR